MIEVATLAEALAVGVSEDGRPVTRIEAGSPSRVYFEGDTLPAHLQRAELSDAERLAQLRDAAKALLTADDAADKRFRALALVLVDELNRHAEKTNALIDAINGAATLAGLKVLTGNIQKHSERTFEQLRAAMRNKIDDGSA